MCRQVHRGQLSVIFFTNSSANILRRPGLSDGYESPIYLTSGHLLHWQREEKKPIWRTTETTDAHTSHYATRSPPSPSPIFLDVREIYGLRWSWIKGTPGCVLSPSPINSRGRRSFPTAHSFYSIRSSVLQYPFDPLYPGSVPRRCASFLSRFCSPWCRWLLPSARGGNPAEPYSWDSAEPYSWNPAEPYSWDPAETDRRKVPACGPVQGPGLYRRSVSSSRRFPLCPLFGPDLLP